MSQIYQVDVEPSRGLKRKADKFEQKIVKKNKHCRASKAKWTPEEDEVLTRAVLVHGEGNWKKVAQTLHDRSHLQCLHRWQKVLNPALVKGPWKDEEDQKLMDLVEKYGPKDWSIIASNIQGRIGKQCRERWFNHLSPEVRKTNWSTEEDRIIVDSHLRLGNKWTAISKLLNGRPANAIKNHWNSTLLKRIQEANISKRERVRPKVASKLSPKEELVSTTDDESGLSDCSPQTLNTSDQSISDPYYQDSLFVSSDQETNAIPWDWPASHAASQACAEQSECPSTSVMAPSPFARVAAKEFEYSFMDHHSPEFSDFESQMNSIPEVHFWSGLADGDCMKSDLPVSINILNMDMPTYCSLPLM